MKEALDLLDSLDLALLGLVACLFPILDVFKISSLLNSQKKKKSILHMLA